MRYMCMCEYVVIVDVLQHIQACMYYLLLRIYPAESNEKKYKKIFYLDSRQISSRSFASPPDQPNPTKFPLLQTVDYLFQ